MELNFTIFVQLTHLEELDESRCSAQGGTGGKVLIINLFENTGWQAWRIKHFQIAIILRLFLFQSHKVDASTDIDRLIQSLPCSLKLMF